MIHKIGFLIPYVHSVLSVVCIQGLATFHVKVKISHGLTEPFSKDKSVRQQVHPHHTQVVLILSK